MLKQKIENIIHGIKGLRGEEIYGEVKAVRGLVVEVMGLEKICSIGTYCEIINHSGKTIKAEVIGIEKEILFFS